MTAGFYKILQTTGQLFAKEPKAKYRVIEL